MTNETQARPKRPAWKKAWTSLAPGFVLGIAGCSVWWMDISNHLMDYGGTWSPFRSVGFVASVVGVILSSVRSSQLISQWALANRKNEYQTLHEAALTCWAGIAIGAVGLGTFVGLKSNQLDNFLVSGIALWALLVGVVMFLVGIVLVIVRLALLLAQSLRGK